MKKISLLALALVLLPQSAPAQDEDPKTFLTNFCFAVAKENDAWLRGRVKLPLNARKAVVPEGGGAPRFEHLTLRTSKQVIEAKICEGLDVEKATASESSRGWTLHVPGKSFEATVELERSPRTRMVSFLER